jgi:hypothetical protein
MSASSTITGSDGPIVIVCFGIVLIAYIFILVCLFNSLWNKTKLNCNGCSFDTKNNSLPSRNMVVLGMGTSTKERGKMTIIPLQYYRSPAFLSRLHCRSARSRRCRCSCQAKPALAAGLLHVKRRKGGHGSPPSAPWHTLPGRHHSFAAAASRPARSIDAAPSSSQPPLQRCEGRDRSLLLLRSLTK